MGLVRRRGREPFSIVEGGVDAYFVVVAMVVAVVVVVCELREDGDVEVASGGDNELGRRSSARQQLLLVDHLLLLPGRGLAVVEAFGGLQRGGWRRARGEGRREPGVFFLVLVLAVDLSWAAGVVADAIASGAERV